MFEQQELSKTQKKKKAAEAHNAAYDISHNLMPIGTCGTCEEKAPLVVYLKSEEQNICNYYCLGCGKVATIKNIDKKDNFFYPMTDIVHEVAKHYDQDVFDKVYNS